MRLSTRLRNQTALTNTAKVEGEKGLWVEGFATGKEPLELALESCWDICERRDCVVALGSCCKVG